MEASTATRVYLCDDAVGLRSLIRLILEEDPAINVVGEAGDGETAVREVAEMKPDVLLLDLSMPGMDGLEALPQIKAAAPDVCVIVFSGFTFERMAAIARSHGADHYVQKGEAELKNLREMVKDCRAIAA